MCQNLAFAVLYVPESGLDCLICARICHCLSDMYQNMALTVLYVPESRTVFEVDVNLCQKMCRSCKSVTRSAPTRVPVAVRRLLVNLENELSVETNRGSHPVIRTADVQHRCGYT